MIMRKTQHNLLKSLCLYGAIVLANLSLDAQTITTYAGTGATTSSGDGGLATAATINGPHGIASDGAGNVYIADYQSFKIRKIDASTGIITTGLGTGVDGFSGDGGLATAA